MQTYLERNRGFITASKLKEFIRCQRCYYLKYVLELPDPTVTETVQDHFLIGQAVDDYLTFGKDAFRGKYIAVDVRCNFEEEIAKALERIDHARTKLNKNGTRSGVGLREEKMAWIKIKSLEAVKHKTQLTNSQMRIIQNCVDEFYANSLFAPNPTKKIIEIEYGGFKLRSELDDISDAEKRIKDVKTTANIVKFDPEMYLMNMSFYQFMQEEVSSERYDVMLEVVDKYSFFSRSVACIYSVETLLNARGRFLKALDDLKVAQSLGESGFMPAYREEVLVECPYYKDHGRRKEPIYY